MNYEIYLLDKPYEPVLIRSDVKLWPADIVIVNAGFGPTRAKVQGTFYGESHNIPRAQLIDYAEYLN